MCSGVSRSEDLQLTRFMGRPGDLSPKARFWMFAGWLLPSRFKYVLLTPLPLCAADNYIAPNLPLIVMTGLSADGVRVRKYAT